MIAKAPITAHWGAPASALGDGCRVKDHLVVGDMIVTFDQKLLVLGIEHCPVQVWTGELPDGALRVPQRDQQELGLPICHPAEREHPAVSLDLPVFGQAGLVQIIQVALRVFGLGCAAPGSSEHGNLQSVHQYKTLYWCNGTGYICTCQEANTGAGVSRGGGYVPE